ncbi:hypothetical protein JCM19296_1502 [Nonlabens ulvanivorans]|uniref:Uncharacterized protein n=1 Tax=Nonlabens ulvanivorans TaxID=906888 RepID=A0A081DAF9_NONUL|nr:hypothetical protein [Nonlabens ulvanivorans]GAK75905.1 hypothetical protein JCM19296_1502 [Nonlabens ulvanivorans]
MKLKNNYISFLTLTLVFLTHFLGYGAAFSAATNVISLDSQELSETSTFVKQELTVSNTDAKDFYAELLEENLEDEEEDDKLSLIVNARPSQACQATTFEFPPIHIFKTLNARADLKLTPLYLKFLVFRI